jgi:hypothetical protein
LIPATGILPIGPSTNDQKSQKALGAEVKTLGAFDEVKDQAVEKPDLLCSQFVVPGIEATGSETASSVVSEQGRSECDSGRVLVLPNDRVDGWGLPGHGQARFDCGSFFTLGCLESRAHVQTRLDGVEVAGKVYLKRKRVSCGRPECPVCYESWASREAHRIDYRVSQFKTRMKPIHVTVSPSRKDWALSISEMRKKMYVLSGKVGFFGGSCIFHPFRQDDFTNSWHFSPHFHLIGFGWIVDTAAEFRLSGWIIKNVGVRESVQSTAFYQLSHCGVYYGEGRKHSVTWFGRLSYNKLRVLPEPPQKDVCPLCGRELFKVVWIGGGTYPLPDEEAEFWVDPGGWTYGPRRGDFG